MKSIRLAWLVVVIACGGGQQTDSLDANGNVDGALVDAEMPDASPVDSLVIDAVPDAPIPDAPPPEPLATGIRINRISLWQATQIDLVANEQQVLSLNAPVIPGRDAVVVGFVELENDWVERDIRAILTIENAGSVSNTLIVERGFAASSTETWSTGLRFDIPAADLTATTRFSLSLQETTDDVFPGTSNAARFPALGRADLPTRSSGGPLRITVVPFIYHADGSGRAPPAAAAAAYEAAFRDMYPVADVVVTVRAAVDYNNPVLADGTGMGDFIETTRALRAADDPPAATYYFGVISPAASIWDHCSDGCVGGVGYPTPPSLVTHRVAVGITFTDAIRPDIAIHEIGHNHERRHAPCGTPSSLDSNYPYPGGEIGVSGWQSSTDTYLPATRADFMGYCEPQWVSDYTYRHLFERIVSVNAQPAIALPTVEYRYVQVGALGFVKWLDTQRSPAITGTASRRTVTIKTGGKLHRQVDGHFIPYDHLPGGVLAIPTASIPPRARIEVAGLGSIVW